MTDLNALLQDFKDKRLAYKEINRTAHEALLDGIVAEIEALKAYLAPLADFRGEMKTLPDAGVGLDAVETPVPGVMVYDPPKRGPGRPPKPEAAA